jgi:hypothetical protein
MTPGFLLNYFFFFGAMQASWEYPSFTLFGIIMKISIIYIIWGHDTYFMQIQ